MTTKQASLLSKITELVEGQEREFLEFMAESANSANDYSKYTLEDLLECFIEFEEAENGGELTLEIMDDVLPMYVEGFESGDGIF
jgi:hypothetical protein